MANKGVLAIVVIAIVVIGGILIFSNRDTQQPSDTTDGNQPPAEGQLAPSGDEEKQPGENVPAPGEEAGEEEGTDEEAPAKEITVSGTEYSFSPDTIRVQPGQEVRVTFENTGSIGHDFVVEGLDVGTEVIEPGNTDSVTFTAPSSSGEYPMTFLCSVPGHQEAGMEGTLIVEE